MHEDPRLLLGTFRWAHICALSAAAEARAAARAGETPARAAAPSAPSAQLGNVGDLQRVRGEGYAEVAEIAELCALAGCPERAAGFVSAHKSATAVWKELLTARAEAGAASTRSIVVPGDAPRTVAAVADSAVVQACKQLAAADAAAASRGA
jgi:hypothetical protein